MNFLKIFRDSFADNWDKPAVTSYATGLTLSYGVLGARIERVNRLLEMLHVPAGAHIAVIGGNSIDWITNYMAAMLHGAVAVTTQVTYETADMLEMLATADTEILFIDRELMPGFSGWSSVPSLGLVISQDTQTVLVSRSEAYADAQRVLDGVDQEFVNMYPNGMEPGDVSAADVKPDSPAAIFFTAGTLGPSRPVLLSCDNIEGNVIYGMKALLFPRGSRTLTSSSVGNVWGTIFNVVVPLASGAHITVFNDFYNPNALVGALKLVKPRRVIMSPRQLRDVYTVVRRRYERSIYYRLARLLPFNRRLVDAGMRNAFDRATGRHCAEVVIGSTNADRRLKAMLHRVGIRYTVSYGLTECGGLVCYTPEGDFNPATVGHPIRNIVKCRLRPIEIQGLPEDAGVLEIRGMTVMKGYYNDPESTRGSFTQDGWFSTGDLATINRSGEVSVIGRLDTIITRQGGTIVPERLEARLLAEPGVRQALIVDRDGVTTAVIVPDDSIGESDDAVQAVDSIIDRVNGMIPPFARIEDVEIYRDMLDVTLKGTIARYKYL
ncbi:MAG: AMP-binding protein [Muribaculaceae bacterium]|nr:AMP-binding protein [Muribaculaceae bacterium]